MAAISLVAHDVAPSECFGLLGPLFEEKGVRVNLLVGYGRPVPITNSALRSAVAQCEFVLLGMSSSSEWAEIEIRAGECARELGIRYGFYSDSPLCVYRAREGAWFHSLAKDSSLISGLLPKSLESLTHLFPKALAIHTGNPLRDAMAFPRVSRKEARARIGIRPHEKLILAPGGKYPLGNGLVWGMLVEALCASRYVNNSVVVISPHPGDTATRAIDSVTGKSLNLYEMFSEDSPVRMRCIARESFATMDVLPGADLVVEFTGSTSVAAAYQRIPVISLTPQIWLNHFKKGSGEAVIETVEEGASIQVDMSSVSALTQIIEELLDPFSLRATSLREAQSVTYKPPEDSYCSLRRLMDAVEFH